MVDVRTRPVSTQNRTKRWKMPWVTAGIILIMFVGILIVSYPIVASWFSQYNQSQLIVGIDKTVEKGPATKLEEELDRAHEYNELLTGGALLSPASNVPTSEVTAGDSLNYFDLLNLAEGSAMGRLRISSIKVDLPIYHGTSDETLAKGVGHLQGTALPIGGVSMRSVLTAHRGLPEATLFNDLHRVELGSTFTIEIFGEVLTYRVIETETILPDETQTLVPEYGRDLVTLVTCTPLGINTHRYLVTGERVIPTPIGDLERAGSRPEIPGFPWWAMWISVSFFAAVVYVWRAGYEKSLSRR